MPRRIGHLEDPLLRQQRLDLVPGNDVALFQCLDGEIFAGVSILRQYDLAKMTSSENGQQPEVLETHTGELRLAARLVRAVAVLQWPRRYWHLVGDLMKSDVRSWYW